MAVASPQRPAQGRHSKSLSPRRPGVIVARGGQGKNQRAEPGPGSDSAASPGRAARPNQKSIERLRSVGFPRATGGALEISKGGRGIDGGEFGKNKIERSLRGRLQGKGRGRDGQPQHASSPLGIQDDANGDGERAWDPKHPIPAGTFVPRGIKGAKKAYESALKAFQDLVRELDLPSNRRVQSPKAMDIDADDVCGGSTRTASAECMSEHGAGGSCAASVQSPEELDNNLALLDQGCAVRVPDTQGENEQASNTVDTHPAAVPAQFCSSDACSLRKDVTAKTRRLLSSPSWPVEAAHSQMSGSPCRSVGVDNALRGGDESGTPTGLSEGGHREGRGWGAGAGQSDSSGASDDDHMRRRPVSASHFDSRNIFSIYHERDLRERPATCRTDYIRACAEQALSPIPVFDHLLALGDRYDSGPATVEHGEGEGTGNIFDLDLRSYGLGPKRSLALAAFLTTFRVVDLRCLRINIEGCGVPEPAMAAVLQALKEEKRVLASLDISGNQIKGERTAKLVADLLEQPDSSLTTLRLRGCSLSLPALTALVLPVQDRRSCLISLCLSRNGFGGVGAGAALASLVDSNISLTSLDLSDNHLGGPQLAMIIQALAINSTMRTLDVGWNNFCDDQVTEALVEALKENRTLTRLEVGYAGIGEEACLRLSEVLLGNRSGIRHLGVPGNAIGPFGAQALLLAMGVEGIEGVEGDQTEARKAERTQQGAPDSHVPEGSVRGKISGSDSGRKSVGGEGREESRGEGEGGGEGGRERAWLTIDMKGCCLARKVVDNGTINRAGNASAFDPTAPNGDYTLDLSNALDRHVARRLQRLAGTQSGKCWVQSKFNKKVFSFPTEDPSSFELPVSGVLELTFASNRPVQPPAWKDSHFEAALQQIEVGGEGVDDLVGVRLAESVMELHPLTVPQGLAMISIFSSCTRGKVAAALIRHNPCTEAAEKILERLHPNERAKVEDAGSMGLFLRWFSSSNPTCRYRLRLGIPAERVVATRLADLNMLERRALCLAGMHDMSQNGDWDNFRNGTLDGKPFSYPVGGGWVPPQQGLFTVDYVSPFQPAILGGDDGKSPSPMGDQAFRDFVSSYVVLEDNRPPLYGEAAETSIAEAFFGFDQSGQDPCIAQTFMTKASGFPRTPSLQQIGDAIAEVRIEHPSRRESDDGPLAAQGDDDNGSTNTSSDTNLDDDDNDGNDDKNYNNDDDDDDESGSSESDRSRVETDKEQKAKGKEARRGDRETNVEDEQHLDLEQFAHVWRLLLVRGFSERRLPFLRRLSSKVWLSADQLCRIYYALKNDKRSSCDPVEVVVFFFRRLTDPENFHRVTQQISDEDRGRLGDALGWLNVFNPFRPDGYYRLHLNRPDEKRVAAAVMELVRGAMDTGKLALAHAFSSGAFGAHTERFVPPKTWKRSLPTYGLWSFKLALELISTEPSPSSSLGGENSSRSSTSGTSVIGESNERSSSSNNSDEAGAKTSQKEELDDSNKDDSASARQSSDQTGGGSQQVEGIPVDVNTTSFSQGDSDSPPSLLDAPAPPSQAKDHTIDNWPGRTVCREVAEKYLSWEFEESDFCVPVEGDGAAGDFGDSETQREEEAAIRAALVRRQVKLLAMLASVERNDEARPSVTL